MPRPGPGEVLVKAHAIGVCMPETYVRKGVYRWMPPLPAIPGIEMSGTVVEAGSGTSRLRVGQNVFVTAREFKERGGCYAEYLAAREDLLYPLPDGIDLDQAAGLANYQVAWHLLNSALKGFQYDSALVVAAAGGVGTALVQLAKAAGQAGHRRGELEERAAFARAQGADEVIDRKRGNVVAETKRLTGGRGVDLVLDPAGGAEHDCVFRVPRALRHADPVRPPRGSAHRQHRRRHREPAVAQRGVPVLHHAYAR
jgi:NADPH2:quinone reductase